MPSCNISIEDRISRLERLNRLIGFCLIAVPCLTFLMGVAANDLLRAKKPRTQARQ